MALAALGAVAVLDAGSSTAEAAADASPFAGSWSGTWSIQNEVYYSGTFDWTISDAGRLSGRVSHTQDGQGGAIRGHIRADGYIVFIGYAPSDDAALHGGGLPFEGTAVIDRDGRLVASLLLSASPFAGNGLVAILERN